MTQNALIPITSNTLAKAEDVMGNFEYLQGLITTYVAQIEDKADADTVSSKINTLNTSLNTVQSNFTESIEDLSGVTNPVIKTLAGSGTIALDDNSINVITPTGAVTFGLPTITDNTKFHQILVQVNLSTVYSINVGTTYYFNKKAPDMSVTGYYNLIYEYDKQDARWICGCMKKGSV